MRWVGTILIGLVVGLIGEPLYAMVPPVIDPTIELDANRQILVSSLHTKRGETFMELYNNTERHIDISGWSVRFSSLTSESDVVISSGWLLSDQYVAFAEGGAVAGVLGFPASTIPSAEPITSVQVHDASGELVSEVGNFPSDIISKWYQRKSTGMSGTFLNDFSAATASTRLRHSPLYLPPLSLPILRVVEIYPRSSNCAPTDASTLCGDYIKLYNPSDATASVAEYRLRSDSSSSESSNAFHLDAYDDIPARGYLTVSLRDDGDRLSLTDDGGWLWLEDSAGIIKYEETVVSYPSAGSTTKIGHSWALADDGVWMWSSTPMPETMNSFPVVAADTGSVLAETAECPQGKYRNPETNRCRNIEDAIATLAACAEGQARNPETNRCRSTLSASVTLVPCGPDQERNRETNRCRSVAAASSSLTPCLTGQERNPETNRCRKSILSSALTPAAIDPIQSSPGSSSLMWVLVGVVGVGAVSYGLYEWRSELMLGYRGIIARVGKK